MIWDETGFLLSKNRYNENSLIVEFYTKDHGKASGIVFGGTSHKIKNYLQIGNKVFVNYNSKFENKMGYFKIEIQQAFSPQYFDNQQKLMCISCAMNLIKILTAESQKNEQIFDLIENFYILLNDTNWIKNYVFWELQLFKFLGYDLKFDNLVEKKSVGNRLLYIAKSSTAERVVPNFLINRNQESENLKDLLIGLKLLGDYLEKSILKQKNLALPHSRLQFINTLK